MESWFEHEFGFPERGVSCDKVRDAFILEETEEGVVLVSRSNQRRFFVGRFEAPTLSELRRRVAELEPTEIRSTGPAMCALTSVESQRDLDDRTDASDEPECDETHRNPTDPVQGSAEQAVPVSDRSSKSSHSEEETANTDGGRNQRRSDLGPGGSLGGLTFANIAGNARALHMDAANAGAVFQVASQFNCLEMVGPGERPEHGVTQYFKDKTQGPACAMACPAATLFRNYFCPVQHLLDQSQPLSWSGQLGGNNKQLDTAADVGTLLGNRTQGYWALRNGYLLPKDPQQMKAVARRLKTEEVVDSSGEKVPLREAAAARMRVGVHWSTQTATPSNQHKATALPDSRGPHRVCQVLCSAVPVAYAKSTTGTDWAPLACCLLDAQYEATLAVAAILARRQARRVTVYLTSVGGGAFGNRSIWIVQALAKALRRFRRCPLDVRMVHYMRVPKGDFASFESDYPAAAAAPSHQRQAAPSSEAGAPSPDKWVPRHRQRRS